jgi:CheY-like chemotaxis protein
MMAKKILTVEDAPNIRKLIAYNLKRAGYEVLEAEDGKAAVRVLNQLVPDLIILDIRMPEMDGFALLELMRKYPKAAAIPVIMLTALSTAADLDRALQLGVVDYLVKPLDPTLLLAKVESVLAREGLPIASATPPPLGEWRGPNRRQFVRGSIHGLSLSPSPGGTGVNLGEGGLSWLTKAPPAIGEIVSIDAPVFFNNVGILEGPLRARVVFLLNLHDGYHRVGATFIGLSETARNAVRRYVLGRQNRFSTGGGSGGG